ncbi:MAG: UDP-2,3-diacylglucosamine diphosphatase [Gemmatimonadales bacterium]
MREIGSMRGVTPGWRIYSAVPTETLAIIADAHLGADTPESTTALHQFLATVPTLADHLVIAGDLFAFLFVHARVMPRSAFATLAALRGLRERGTVISVVGGNHDRWARDLWEREIGATFHPDQLAVRVGTRQVLVRHGDGLVEPDALSRWLGSVVRWRPVIGLVRWMHPDIMHGMVQRFAHRLTGREEQRDTVAQTQRAWATAALGAPDAPDVLVLGHSHVAVAEEVTPGRWYVNPGAWMDGGCYAVVRAGGTPTLARWTGP